MYDESILNKLKIAQKELELIFKNCNQVGGIEQALTDIELFRPSIMKHFDIIHEQINKINQKDENIINKYFKSDDIAGLRSIRNISSHSYYDLHIETIANSIQNDLPNFKKDVQKCIKTLININKLESDIKYFNNKKNILTIEAKEKIAKNILQSIDKIEKENIEIDENLKNDAFKILNYNGLKFE